VSDDRQADLVDRFVDELYMNGQTSFSVADFRGWLEEEAPEILEPAGHLLQVHRKTQGRTDPAKRPVYTLACTGFGPRATWTIVDDPTESHVILDRLCSQLARRATKEITCRAQPVARRNPDVLRLVAIEERVIQGRLREMAELIQLIGNQAAAEEQNPAI
jgi:hypothetical protein